MRPILSYYGGKQKIARHIVKLIPQHTVYVEPFVGGAAILYNKKRIINKDYIEVINDINGNLINMYRCFQEKEKREILLEKLRCTLYSRGEWNNAKRIVKGNIDLRDIDRALIYYIYIMQGFSNMLGHNGWSRCSTNNKSYIWKRRLENLSDNVKRLEHVTIEENDALEIIKLWDSPHTFYYCDPPYINAEQNYGTKEYVEEDLKKLVATLNECKGSFILSGYDTDLVPKEWERFEINITCTAINRRKNHIKNENIDISRKEILWRRFNIEEPEKEIQRLYNSGEFSCFVKHPEFSQEIITLCDSKIKDE